MMSAQQKEATLNWYREQLTVPADHLKRIADAFQSELEKGLADESSLLMIPTMVDILPQGHESGEYYAIDLGGTNLRVLYVRLGAQPKSVEAEAIHSSQVPPELQSAPVEELMNYVVDHIVQWSQHAGCSMLERPEPVIGFCFSFPVEQASVNSGKLLRWTKGYTNPGAVGQDPAKLLAEAFRRKDIQANIGALINDTVGVLAAVRYIDGTDTFASVIMGTGTNACYIEQLGRITKWLPHYRPRTPDMVVNIEWPGFQATELPVLDEDRQLDEDSSNTGEQCFEKLTAGLYMGDIARRIILRCVENGELFGGSVPKKMRVMEQFETRFMAVSAQDDTPDLSATAGVLSEAFGMEAGSIDHSDLQEVKQICSLVSVRSARLIAAAMCGILAHLQRDKPRQEGEAPPRSCIAVDGGVLVRYKFYRELLVQGVREILGDAVADQFQLKVVPGGSAFGAACMAAATTGYMKSMGSPRGQGQKIKFPPRRLSATSLNMLGSS
ncbi:hypothetical protein CVIRNUC_007545 [Coccomyxa viridis]|uniref:Phosphotransferase n=1 Tax=Coccomyxa viridis TaxID=1274662 RepID=A0AAV1IC89_9CHLO|nr:hypothetical protein CVIRNUC_007545 [Coccomyxa viridis]